MNATSAHNPLHFPTVALKSDGGVLVLPDLYEPYEGDDEPTLVDIEIRKLQKEDTADAWVDGMTLFALLLTFTSFLCMCATDIATKAEAKRAQQDTNCAITSR